MQKRLHCVAKSSIIIIVRIAICRNDEKIESRTILQSLTEALAHEGIAFYAMQDNALAPDTDMLCVIGGDGTLFAAAHSAIDMDVPIWFINAGSVGFLAESSANLAARVARIAAGDYELISRDLLDVVDADGKCYRALNDVCLMRDTIRLQTVTLTVTAGDERVSHFRGDGALVCTALGSTGYALSAGAAIMAPNAKGMMFVPIAAHSLSALPVLFGEDTVLNLSCVEDAELFVDGVNCDYTGGEVQVRTSDKKVRFVVTEKQVFFAKISTKLL